MLPPSSPPPPTHGRGSRESFGAENLSAVLSSPARITFCQTSPPPHRPPRGIKHTPPPPPPHPPHHQHIQTPPPTVTQFGGDEARTIVSTTGRRGKMLFLLLAFRRSSHTRLSTHTESGREVGGPWGGALCFRHFLSSAVDDFGSGWFDVSPGSERREGSGINETRRRRRQEPGTGGGAG